MVQCPDAHLFCRDCARRSAEECIGNRKTDLLCMDQSGCKLAFAESEVQRFLSEKSLELWHRVKQELEIELVWVQLYKYFYELIYSRHKLTAWRAVHFVPMLSSLKMTKNAFFGARMHLVVS